MCFFLGIVSIFIVIFVLWFCFYADGDCTLLFAERFGKSVADLKGKVIWVTGASSGIGEGVALELASLNAKLILSGTNLERLQNVQKQCLLSSSITEDDVLLLCFDISNCNEHEGQVAKALQRFKKIDVLINNAGRSQRSDFENIENDVDRELFGVNVFGLVNLSRLVLRHFLENGGGQFVVTSSTAGIFGVPHSATYTASKHALHGYFECLRTEKVRKGISVTIACPGPVRSRVLENAFTGKKGEVHGGKHLAEDRRMTAARCAHLMLVAAVNKLDHAWIAIQPVLLTHYLAQYFPTFFRTVCIRTIFGSSFAKKMRDGNAKVSEDNASVSE